MQAPLCAIIVAAVAAVLATTATAQTTSGAPQAGPPVAAPQAAATGAPAKDLGDQDKVICKTIEVTGSHLGSTRRCMTRSRWEDMERASRDEVDRIRSVGLSGPPH
jgi:hypothetical protein